MRATLRHSEAIMVWPQTEAPRHLAAAAVPHLGLSGALVGGWWGTRAVATERSHALVDPLPRPTLTPTLTLTLTLPLPLTLPLSLPLPLTTWHELRCPTSRRIGTPLSSQKLYFQPGL